MFLKRLAREKLSGIYFSTVIGQLICCIPVYLFSLLIMLVSMKINNFILALAIGFIGEIFVTDIFSVGYIRSLIHASDGSQTDAKRYDINTVLSGFTENYRGTLKTMFMRRLYLFGWGILMLLPVIMAVGVIAFLSYRPEVSQLISYVMQIMESPTEDMIINTGNYMTENCAYIGYLLSGASILSLMLAIPYVRKVYLYEMIPMVMAENPDTTAEEAFCRTKEIMNGYRLKYFILQLSFIGILILVELVTMIDAEGLLGYFAIALAYPYMMMTFIQFYLSRTRAGSEEQAEEAATEE